MSTISTNEYFEKRKQELKHCIENDLVFYTTVQDDREYIKLLEEEVKRLRGELGRS